MAQIKSQTFNRWEHNTWDVNEIFTCVNILWLLVTSWGIVNQTLIPVWPDFTIRYLDFIPGRNIIGGRNRTKKVDLFNKLFYQKHFNGTILKF